MRHNASSAQLGWPALRRWCRRVLRVGGGRTKPHWAVPILELLPTNTSMWMSTAPDNRAGARSLVVYRMCVTQHGPQQIMPKQIEPKDCYEQKPHSQAWPDAFNKLLVQTVSKYPYEGASPFEGTPPPLSFPTPGKTVPHHPPWGTAPPPYTHICGHRNCSIKRKNSA